MQSYTQSHSQLHNPPNLFNVEYTVQSVHNNELQLHSRYALKGNFCNSVFLFSLPARENKNAPVSANHWQTFLYFCMFYNRPVDRRLLYHI